MIVSRRVALPMAALALAARRLGAEQPPGAEPRLRLVADEDAERAVPVLRRRLAALGLGSAAIEVEGQTIVVDLPEAADPPRIATLLTRPGRFALHGETTVADLLPLLLADPAEPARPLRLARVAALAGDVVASAEARPSPASGEWDVFLRLRQDAAERMRTLTAANLGRVLAFVLDDTVLVAPRVQEEIDGGVLVISRHLGREEARALAALLGGGALPVALRLAPPG